MLIQITRLALAAGVCVATLTSCGGGSASSPAVTPPPPPPPVREQGIRQFVGAVGEVIDYAALTRDLFAFPTAIAPDGAGNFYVADSGKILKVTAAGNVTRAANLPGCYQFYGAAVDKAGILYTACGDAIYKMSPAGEFTLIAGASGDSGFAGGKGAAARFHWPQGVAVGSDGSVLVADVGNFRIRKISADGTVTTLAGNGTAVAVDGSGTAAGFRNPRGIAIDSQGNVYVGDGNAVRKMAPDGMVTTVAGDAEVPGGVDGQGTAARFYGPWSLTVAVSGEVYVADSNAVRVISPVGLVSTLASGFVFKRLVGITLDAAGNPVVIDADDFNHQIRKVTLAGQVTTLAGTESSVVVTAPKSLGFVDGEGAQVRFSDPRGVAVDAQGTTYVADYGNSALRKVTKAGVVTTAVRFPGTSALSELAVDSLGNPYTLGGLGVVQKIAASGAYSEVPLPSSQLYPGYESAIAVRIAADGAGNIYIAYVASHRLQDCGSWGPHVPCPTAYKLTFQKVTAAGQWSTIATSDDIDRLASGASPYTFISGLAADRSGNLYASDTTNHRIIRIASSGAVSIFAGTPGVAGSADGAGSAARFFQPTHMAADAAGNVYVVDSGNYTIRKITPAGSVTTIAGTVGSYKLTLGALPGSLPIVSGLAVDADGHLVASVPNGLIKITLP